MRFETSQLIPLASILDSLRVAGYGQNDVRFLRSDHYLLIPCPTSTEFSKIFFFARYLHGDHLQYLRAHAVELGSRILDTFPQLQSTKDPVATRIATLLRKALPAQGLAITGTAKYLRKAKAARLWPNAEPAKPTWRWAQSMCWRMDGPVPRW